MQRGEAARLLVVQRGEEQHGVGDGADEEHRDDGHREAPAGEHPQVDQRHALGPQGVDHVAGEQYRADGEGREHLGGGEVAALAGGGQAEDQCGEAGGKQDQAEDVQGLARVLGPLVGGQGAQRQQQGDQADRHVDQEHPAPVDGVDQGAADDRAEDGAQGQRDRDQAHGLGDPGGSGGRRQYALHHRDDHAAAEALQQSEADEGTG